MKVKYKSSIKWILSSKRIQHSLVNDNQVFSDKQEEIGRKVTIVAILVVISLLSFVRTIFIYSKQFRVSYGSISSNIDAIILKTGRGYDHLNILENIDQNMNIMYIQAFDFREFMMIERVSFFKVLENFTDAVFDYYVALYLSPSKKIRNILILSAISQISSYVYLLSFFQKVKCKIPSCKIYSAGAIHSCNAAISANLKTIYMYHGMMEKYHYQAIPNFSSVYAYSRDDKLYLKDLNVDFPINIYSYSKLEEYTNSIIIFAPIQKKHLIEIIQLVGSCSYSVYIKQHPFPDYSIDENIVMNECRSLNIEFISSNVYKNARSLIANIKPRYVFGGLSTALCEALNMDVIPINIENETEAYYRTKSILSYNFDRRCLSWKNNRKIINDLILDRSSYKNTLNQLNS